jgi:hypothetical protein
MAMWWLRWKEGMHLGVSLAESAQFYPLFEQNKVAKTIFVMD